jgi:hypothetical protein
MKSVRSHSLAARVRLGRRATEQRETSLFAQLLLIEQRICASGACPEGFIPTPTIRKMLNNRVKATPILRHYIE